MEGGKANLYAALQGGEGGGVNILSKSALRNGWTFPEQKSMLRKYWVVEQNIYNT